MINASLFSPSAPGSPSSLPGSPIQKSESSGHLSIGSPYNVTHNVHVDTELKWHGNDPTQLFDILEKLGEGGYGAVYKAKHKISGFVLALKKIKLESDTSSVMDEIGILRKCRHSNIVSYYGSYVDDDTLWIMMECINLGSISDILEATNEGLTEPQIATVCCEVLKGLVYLHSLNIVHKDLKAGNILLSKEAQVRIVDFGISEQIDSNSKESEPVGSPFWMAPEIIMEGEPSVKCDIWSLGITVIEMAECAPPLHHMHPLRALFMIPKNKPPTFAKQENRSPELISFVACCLQKNPVMRPTAEELLNHPFIQQASDGAVLRPLVINYMKVKKQKQKELELIAALSKTSIGVSDTSVSQPTTADSTMEIQQEQYNTQTTIYKTVDIQSAGSSLSEITATEEYRTVSVHATPVTSAPVSGNLSKAFDAEAEGGGRTPYSSPVASMSDLTKVPFVNQHNTYAPDLNIGAAPLPPSPLRHSSLPAPPTGKHRIDTAVIDEQYLAKHNPRSRENRILEATQVDAKSEEMFELRQMVIDMKIQMCKVREEMGAQNAELKSELADIKKLLMKMQR